MPESKEYRDGYNAGIEAFKNRLLKYYAHNQTNTHTAVVMAAIKEFAKELKIDVDFSTEG